MSNNLVYRKVVEGIGVYEFYSNSRSVVDAYLELAYPYMKEHIELGKVKLPYCYVLDVSRSGMYPINYMVQRAKTLLGHFEEVPENYIAFIVKNPNDAVLINLIRGMTARTMSHTRQVFSPAEFDQAIAWLQDVIRKSEQAAV